MTQQTSRGYPYPALSDQPNGPAQLQALAAAINADVGSLAGSLASGDTGWVTITPGSIWAPGAGPDLPQARLINGIVYWHGLIQTSGGGTIPANTTQNLVLPSAGASGGSIPQEFWPTFKQNRPLSSYNPDSDFRGILDTDGSLKITTGASSGAYVDLSNLSGYPAT